ncbi:hypothetical protein GCM10027047_36570 [Rhodococcus aerolatus]
MVRPSCPPGESTVAAGDWRVPRNTVPSVVEVTQNVDPCEVMPSGKTSCPGSAMLAGGGGGEDGP